MSNIFRTKYAESRAPKPTTEAERAANAAARAAQPAADAAHRAQALQVWRAYSGADAITRAKIRASEHGHLIEAGRMVAAETEPPGPEAA